MENLYFEELPKELIEIIIDKCHPSSFVDICEITNFDLNTLLIKRVNKRLLEVFKDNLKEFKRIMNENKLVLSDFFLLDAIFQEKNPEELLLMFASPVEESCLGRQNPIFVGTLINVCHFGDYN